MDPTAAVPSSSAAVPSDGGVQSISPTFQGSPAPADKRSQKPSDTPAGNPPVGSTGKPTNKPAGTPGNAPVGHPTPTPTPPTATSNPSATIPTASVASPTPTPPSSTPTRTVPSQTNLCGAPPNPWGYNFCSGNKFEKAPSNFCSYFLCTSTFWTKASGYVEQCVDGQYSNSDGEGKGCAGHGGPWRALLTSEES